MSRATAAAVAAIVLAAALPACQGHDKPASPQKRCGFPSQSLPRLGKPQEVWSHETVGIGYYSPRAVDLRGDGKATVIVNGGREKNPTGNTLALDGATGAVAWEVPARQELYNNPTFLDINHDGVKDVFVGGRNKEFMAIDGATGNVLWLFQHAGVDADDPWFNFYTAVVIDDRTGDGTPDLLIATGGADYIHEPRAPRPSGGLLIVDAVTGTVIAYGSTPDHEEIYMSPLVLPATGPEGPIVLFGTGGESRPGSLWKVPLGDIPPGGGNRTGESDLVTAKAVVVSDDFKGMIAPPALADLNGDGRNDIIVPTFDGRLVAIDGATDAKLWERVFEGSESFTTPAVGYFDGDAVPDVFAVFLRGVFPEYTNVTRALISGADGSIIWERDRGNFSMSGDVAVDLDGDGQDEVIFSSNDLDADPAQQQQLFILDTKLLYDAPFGPPLGAFAAGSPWVGDLDGDGCLDLAFAHTTRTDTSTASIVSRYKIPTAVPEHISWPGYLGANGDSTFHPWR